MASRRFPPGAWFFLSILLAHLSFHGGHLYTVDEESQYRTSESLVLSGSWAITPAKDRNLNLTQGRDGAWFSYYPPGLALTGFPFVLAGHTLTKFAGAGDHYLPRAFFAVQGAFWAALLALLVAQAVRTAGASPRTAFVTGFVHAFGTYAAMQARAPHSILPAACAVLYAWTRLLGNDRTGLAGLKTGFVLGLGLLFRYELLLLVPFLLPGGRRYAAGVLVGLLPAMISLTAFNAYRFGHPLSTGAPDAAALFAGEFLTGLYGLTLSPNRGVLWYSPLSVLGIAGLWMLRHRIGRPAALALSAFLFQLLFAATLPHWAGGATWGPRYLAMTLPLLSVGLWPFLERSVTWIRTIGIASAVALQVYGAVVSTDSWNDLLWDHGLSFDLSWHDARYNPWYGQWEVLRRVELERLESDYSGGTTALPVGATSPNQAIRRSLDFWQIYAWKLGIPWPVPATLTAGLLAAAVYAARRVTNATAS